MKPVSERHFDRQTWPTASPSGGAALAALGIVAAAAYFWSGLVSLAEAWQRPEYSHGPLIPLISLYLFLRQLRQVPETTAPVTDRWPGFGLALFALALGAVGNLAEIPDLVTYAMIAWIAAMILTSFGWRRGRAFWPPVLHLAFMLPLPNFIYWKMSITLQFISSELGVELIRLMAVPVFLDGNIIDLGVYKLHVAEACSGLRYLFPILSFSYIFAVLYNGPTWHKVVLLLSAAPITILMNSFRIGVIGVLVDRYGIEQAEGFLHVFEGWVIFLTCVAILFGLAALMQRLQPDPSPLADAIDLDTSGLGRQAARFVRIAPSVAMLLCVLSTATAALAWRAAPERAAATIEREPLALFPRALGDWTSGQSRQLPPDISLVLGADDYRLSSFSAPDAAAPVDLFVAYYHKLTQGSGIHSPEICIPAGGWEMSRIDQAAISSGAAEKPWEVNRAIIQKGVDRQLVFYWFEQRGRRLTNDYMAKAYTVLDAVTIGRTDGALVRLTTPIMHGETERAAENRLRRFIDASLPELPRFIPG